MKGDYNKNGRVDIGDAQYLASKILKNEELNLEEGDLNDDGVVDMRDVFHIVKSLANVNHNIFEITVNNNGGLNENNFTNYKNVILKAFDKWNTIIKGVKDHTINDFKIKISVNLNSLSGSVLGSASIIDVYDNNGGSKSIVNVSEENVFGRTLYPYSGTFTLNSNLINLMNGIVSPRTGNSFLYYVTLHEIGHIIGIGQLWGLLGYSWDYNTIKSPVVEYTEDGETKYYYNGINGLREYRNVCSNQELVGIPIEDDGGEGTCHVHIEEGNESGTSTDTRHINNIFHPGLDEELMTGWAENPSDKDLSLSKVTVGLLDDLGYIVDYYMADDFTL